MNSGPEKYLLDLADELPMRKSQPYAQNKLYALQAYLSMARVSMKGKGWYSFNYIDLQAGPGKNIIENAVYLGSPLIALNITPTFDDFWFNELNDEEFNALETRVSQSPLRSHIHLMNQDVNIAVDTVVQQINEMDSQAKKERKWSTFNIAFLDPEGLELNWATVEKLARINRMDLIINFSTAGIIRNLHQDKVLDEYFGNNTWRKSVTSGDSTIRRRQLINTYRQQLEQFGYNIIIDDDTLGRHDIAMKNSKNAEVYSLIFASKHPLGDKFWQKVKKQIDKIQHRSNPLF